MTTPHTAGTLTAHGLTLIDSRGLTMCEVEDNVSAVRDNTEEINANAARLALCWNALAHIDNDAVERLGRSLQRYNSDELRDLLADDGDE